ncbi:MAG: NTP transferase domain-containing protein [Archangium sp.]|nr:NTP transferase domain-containing protein [Archangium sp.]
MSALEAIVLAAGVGRRMGGAKALLMVDGVPLVMRHVAALRLAGVERPTVVVRPEVARRLGGVELVVAETRSPAESLAAGARHLCARLGGLGERSVLITPVDMQPVDPRTMDALAFALTDDVMVTTPASGHPVLIRGEALAPYLAGDAPPPLCDVLHRLEPFRRRVHVEDDAAMSDFNTPADLLRVFHVTPQFA